MEDTKDKTREEEKDQEIPEKPKTPQDIMQEIHSVLYPEQELDEKEGAGEVLDLRGGAYDYLKQQYGDREDWKQFETLYQEQLGAQWASTPPALQERLREKQELLDLRMELEGVEGEIDLEQIPEVVEATRREEKRFLERMNSGIAAINAFDQYRISCLKGNDAKKSRELAAAEQWKKEQNLENERLIARRLKEAQEKEPEYLVRGAPIICNCGTHSRHLDMMESHGVYVNQKAVAFEDDYKEANISYFGHCHSPCCDLKETISLSMQTNVSADGRNLTESDGRVLVDIKCVPEFNGPWENPYEGTKISENGREGGVYKRAVTTASYLVCRQGGIVYPLTSGQYDESYYQAPFKEYPFDDIGSDVFFAWCEKNKICPYIPGTEDYYTWNRDKIDGAKKWGEDLKAQHEKWCEDARAGRISGLSQYSANYAAQSPYLMSMGANKKEIKRLYETCLNDAYQQGLDQMPKKETDRIKGMVEEYLDSGLLEEKEKEEIRERYSGLRLKYGDNGLKHKEGYTYQDQALYDETLGELEALGKQRVEIERRPDSSYNGYENRSKTATVRKSAEDLYREFMREVSTYGPGYSRLTPEQKAAAEKIHQTYYEAIGVEQYPDLEEAMDTFDDSTRRK